MLSSWYSENRGLTCFTTAATFHPSTYSVLVLERVSKVFSQSRSCNVFLSSVSKVLLIGDVRWW